MISYTSYLHDVLIDSSTKTNPFIRQDKLKRDDQFDTDWDRFASAEYARLAAEEEGGSEYTASGTMDLDKDGLGRHSSGDTETQSYAGWQLDDDDEDVEDEWGRRGSRSDHENHRSRRK